MRDQKRSSGAWGCSSSQRRRRQRPGASIPVVRLLRRRQGAHAQATDRELRLQRCDVVARRDVVVRLPPRAGSVKKSNGKGVVDVRSKVTAGHRRDRSQLAANLAGDALLKEAKVKKVVCCRKNGSDCTASFPYSKHEGSHGVIMGTRKKQLSTNTCL